MRKSSLLLLMLTIVLSFALVFAGCAKKAAVKETAEEKQVVAEKKAAAETEEEKAAKEKAMKEAELREQERQKAEREKAEKEKAEAAAAAAPAVVSPIAGFEYIYFDFDKYNIKPEARETLKKVADWLNAKENSDYNLVIEGNCDERGTVEYNLALGERRAQSAMKYLANLGVAKDRMSTISYGKERPVDPGHNEEAWAKNRNDHFVVVKRKE